MDLWLAYNTGVLAVLAIMGVILTANLLTFRRVPAGPADERAPFVSVLLPVRNEEAVIDRCLRSLARQDYPRYEVIVLDDGSDDATAARVEAWCRRDPRIVLLRGEPLPAGWVGKSFACHQLAARAKGELLLFVDADTVHEVHAVRAGVTALASTRAGLLSLIPHQEMGAFWERVILPLLHFVTMTVLPFALVTAGRSPRLAMANGQYMLFRRSVYDEIGGHASVRTALVEDVWLSRRVKAAGHRLVVMDGDGAVSCRMYTSFPAIWEGFSKNLFPGFRYSLPAMTAVMVFLTATSVLPFLLLPWAVRGGAGGGLIGAQVGLLLMMRTALAYRFRMAWWPVLLHPLGVGAVVAIAVNSSRAILLGGGAAWKGRRYDFHRHPAAQE